MRPVKGVLCSVQLVTLKVVIEAKSVPEVVEYLQVAVSLVEMLRVVLVVVMGKIELSGERLEMVGGVDS